MGIHPGFKRSCSALLRLAGAKLTLAAAAFIVIGLAGASLLQDVVYERTTLIGAWHTFSANLAVVLSSGLVRLAFVLLGLYLFGTAARSVMKADEARAAKADADAAALVDRDNEVRRQIVSEVKRSIDQALETFTSAATKAHENTITIGAVSELGRRLSVVEPILLEAQRNLGEYLTCLGEDPSDLPGMAALAHGARMATLRGFLAISPAAPPPQIMLGPLSSIEAHQSAAAKIRAKKEELEGEVAKLQSDYHQALAKLRGIK